MDSRKSSDGNYIYPSRSSLKRHLNEENHDELGFCSCAVGSFAAAKEYSAILKNKADNNESH